MPIGCGRMGDEDEDEDGEEEEDGTMEAKKHTLCPALSVADVVLD